MMNRALVLKAFIQKEIRQVLRDPRMRFVLFIAPLVQLTIFGLALSTETRNIRLAAFYKVEDHQIYDIYSRAIGSKWFIPAQVTSLDPFEWIQSDEADAVLIAPEGGLGRSIGRQQGEVQFLINAKNSIRAQAIERYMQAIINETFSEFKTQQMLLPLNFTVRALYNPTFETAFFMVPGVLSMLVCLVTILLTSMSVAREKELGTFETLIAAPLDVFDLILGKTVPFIILGIIQVALIIIFAVIAFKLPVRGPFWMLVLSSLLMITTTVSIGLLISTIAKNQQQAMLGGFLYLFPSYLLSGLMFPVENMPILVRPLAWVNPLTHYIGLLRNIFLMGGNSHYFFFHSSSLLFICIVTTWFAWWRFSKNFV